MQGKDRQGDDGCGPERLSILEQTLAEAFSERKHPREYEKEFCTFVELKRKCLLVEAYSITKCWMTAEDIVQEAVFKLHQYVLTEGFRGDGISAWLHTVVRNFALQHYRRKKSHQTLPLENADAAVDDHQVDSVELDESILRAQSLAEKLPPKQKIVVSLRCQGLSFCEIGERLAITSCAAKQSYHVAVKKLRSQAPKRADSGQTGK